jgi:hypothetical protein
MTGPPRGGPSLLVLTFSRQKKCKHYVSSSAKAGCGLGVFWRAYEAGSKAVWMAATTALPPARDEDGQKPLDRWRDRIRLKMHDDGLAEDVGKSTFSNAVEARKGGRAETDLWMTLSRFSQKPFGRIKAFRRITVSIEPGGVTPATTTDICRWTGDKELPDDGVQVDRRRL